MVGPIDAPRRSAASSTWSSDGDSTRTCSAIADSRSPTSRVGASPTRSRSTATQAIARSGRYVFVAGERTLEVVDIGPYQVKDVALASPASPASPAKP